MQFRMFLSFSVSSACTVVCPVGPRTKTFAPCPAAASWAGRQAASQHVENVPCHPRCTATANMLALWWRLAAFRAATFMLQRKTLVATRAPACGICARWLVPRAPRTPPNTFEVGQAARWSPNKSSCPPHWQQAPQQEDSHTIPLAAIRGLRGRENCFC